MSLPQQVDVGPFTFEVRDGGGVVDFFKGNDDHDSGNCDADNLIIRVSPHQAEGNKRDTLLHEIVHAVAFATGLTADLTEKVEEKVARHLATGLLGVLRDNPDLVTYLTTGT